MEQKYVLREKDHEEISRLEFQHKVWKQETDLAIAKARIFDGEKIIDLGGGPGYLSKDLAELVFEKGEVYCLDNSELFIKFIREQMFTNITVVKLDIRNDLLNYFDQSGQFDKVFCRWVMMFIGDIDKIIVDIYKLLKPGGKFVSIEYFNFKQISMFPKSESFDKIYSGVSFITAPPLMITIGEK